MRTATSNWLLVALIVAAAGTAGCSFSEETARGPDTAATPNAAPTSRAAQADTVHRARAHDERGLALYGEENFGAAIEEFQSAYDISPSYRVLYVIGRAKWAAGDRPGAAAAYNQFLAEGGAEIPQKRRDEVESALSTLEPSTAQ